MTRGVQGGLERGETVGAVESQCGFVRGVCGDPVVVGVMMLGPGEEFGG